MLQELLNKLSDYFKSNENLAQDLVNQQMAYCKHTTSRPS
jgi:hypothetical protein